MLIKNLEKLRKRTLRERIYEEVVRLILAGELPSGGWVDEKRVIDKMRVSRTPIPRGHRDTGSGRAARDQALSRILRTHIFPQRDRGSLRAFQAV